MAAVPDREIGLRPRRVRDEALAASLGGVDPSLDVSPYVALVLLGLFAIELLLRVLGQRSAATEARVRGVGETPIPPPRGRPPSRLDRSSAAR